jgi:Family of unknown function (DUF5318)
MYQANQSAPFGRACTQVDSLGAVTFRADQMRGIGVGTVDYRLARRALLSEFRKGRLARHQVCDAHPELVRAARGVGEPTAVDCPICTDERLVLVTYVFGPRLPAFGRCISSRSEMSTLNRRLDQLTAYVVEVCPACSWNHLARVFPVGKKPRATAPRTDR